MREKEATKKLAQTVRIKFCKTLESSQMFTTTRKNLMIKEAAAPW